MCYLIINNIIDSINGIIFVKHNIIWVRLFLPVWEHIFNDAVFKYFNLNGFITLFWSIVKSRQVSLMWCLISRVSVHPHFIYIKNVWFLLIMCCDCFNITADFGFKCVYTFFFKIIFKWWELQSFEHRLFRYEIIGFRKSVACYRQGVIYYEHLFFILSSISPLFV